MNARPNGYRSQVSQWPVPRVRPTNAVASDMCTSSFQGDLVLLLDLAGGRIWTKYIPAFSLSVEDHSQPLGLVILEACPSDHSFQSMYIIFFQGKTGRWMLLSVPFGLSLVGDPQWVLMYPFQIASLFSIVLFVYWTEAPLDFRVKCFGILSLWWDS